MQVLKISKNGLFYKVKLSDDTVYKLHESIIIDYKILKKGIELSKEKLERIIKDNEYYLALDKGINYLSTLRSKKEVKLYLTKHFDIVIVDKVILKLEELKLIDDFQFAKYYQEVMKKKHYGDVKIKNDLLELGVNQEFILEALKNYEEDILVQNCCYHFEKYINTVKKNSKVQAKNKMTNHLLAKGFSLPVINEVINENKQLLEESLDEDRALVDAYKKILKSKKQTIKEKDFKQKVIRSLSAKGFPLYKILKVIEGGFEYD